MVSPLSYYSNPRVLGEVAEFLRGRWVAVHCERRMRDGRPLLIRYLHGKPLRASSPAELAALLRKLSPLRPRAIYGTVSIYERLESREDVRGVDRVAARTLTWDIDSTPEHWRATVEAARVLLDELERHGVVRSVWLKWSGRGMHVHIHEGALSAEFLKQHGILDTTWSLVQFVAERVKERVVEVNVKHGSRVKVENLMDPQRVFTAPLSLHRELDASCVALKPDELDSFEPSWADPREPRHNPSWREYEPGEAEQLAELALKEVGGYLRRRKSTPLQVRLRALEEALSPPPSPQPLLSPNLEVKPRVPPAPLERRDLRGDPRKAVEYLEDILGHLELGLIPEERARLLLRAAIEVTLRAQGYAPEDVKKLIELYSEVLKLLEGRGTSGP
uniref:Uncharacterized protein n=1 Tax=Thermofilum pendens TaxID=2269 RepID=A0A7C3WSY7_THEPE